MYKLNSEFKVSELILLNIHTEKYFYFVMGENKNFLLCKSLYFLKNLKKKGGRIPVVVIFPPSSFNSLVNKQNWQISCNC